MLRLVALFLCCPPSVPAVQVVDSSKSILLFVVKSDITGGIVSSGVANSKTRPGRARARPKHHVRPAHVTRSRTKRARALVLLDSLEANGVAYCRCPANTNDLATPLIVSERP